jgi:hypothetical protein
MRLREAGLGRDNLKRTSSGYESKGFCDNGIELSSYVRVREYLSGEVITSTYYRNKILPT